MTTSEQMPEELFQQAVAGETETPPQETPAQPPQEPQTAPETTPETPADPNAEFRSLAAAMGYEVPDTASPKDILTAIHNQRNDATRQAEYWEQHATRPAQPPPQQETKQEKTPDEELQEYFRQKWQAPQIDQQWFDYVQRDPSTGMYVSKVADGHRIAPPEIVQKINEYTRWFQQAPVEFFDNPYQKVYDAINEPLTKRMEQLIEQRLQAALEQREASQSIQKYEQDNEKYLYQLDSAGQRMTDRSGNLLLTEYGQKLRTEMQSLYQDGVRDPKRLLDRARRVVGDPVQPEQTEQPAQPATETKPAATTTQQQQQATFLEKAINKASHTSGHDSGTPAPTDGVNVTETELDNMWIQAVGQN